VLALVLDVDNSLFGGATDVAIRGRVRGPR